jgi:hypothetical protein
LDYEEVSQTAEGDTTVVILRVTATYNFGDSMTYNFQNFVLDIRTPRGGIDPFPIYLLTGTAQPFETGSVTVGSGSRHAEFTLTFRFSTIQSSYGGSIHFAYYELVYNSNAVSPSTPERTLAPNSTESPIPTATATSSPVPIGNPFGVDLEQTVIVVLVILVAVLLATTVVVLLYYKKSKCLSQETQTRSI